MSKISYFRQLKGFFIAGLLTFTRSRSAIFFGLGFPIIFVLFFGLISQNSPTKIEIGFVGDGTQASIIKSYLEDTELFDFVSGSEQELKQKIEQPGTDQTQTPVAVVVVQESNRELSQIVVYRNPTEPQSVGILLQTLQTVTDQITLKQNNIEPIFNTNVEDLSSRKIRYIDFALPGLIGFSLLSSGINGTAYSFLALRKNNVLKRLFATPLFRSAFLIGQAGARIIFGLVQNLILIAIASIVFGFTIAGGISGFLEFILVVLIGIMAFMGLGYLIAGLSKKDDQASIISQFIFLPQILLGGTFFPISGLPNWLQSVVKYLPLASFNEATRLISVYGYSLFSAEVATQVGILCLWVVVIYSITSRVFKFEA